MDTKQTVFKVMFFVFVFFALVLFPPDTQAGYQTNLLTGIYLQDGSGLLDAGNWSAPTVYDWDSDGAKDLIVGRRDAVDTVGYVSFYKNYGTDASPVFNGYVDIQACTDPCFAAG